MDVTIPGYEIKRELGRGGMARVYLAIQTSFNREVALKVMLPELAAVDPDVAERFIREGRYVSALRHPNIIKVFDTGVADGFYYLSMEYLEGGTLQDRMRQGLRISDGLDIFKTIVKALRYAHQQGIVHRDIKSQNILLYPDDAPVLCFVGLSQNAPRRHMEPSNQRR